MSQPTHHSFAGTDPLIAAASMAELQRPRLLRRLKAALRTGHVLISAPPGYGKTTLLRSLARTRPRTHHIVLTPPDADLSRLHARLTPLLTANATLLLDDLHLVMDVPEVLDWLQDVLSTSVPRFVLSGRALPSFLVADAALARRLTRIEVPELAFSALESQALLQELLPAQEIDTWQARVQGWPLGLALLAQQPHRSEPELAVPLAEADLFSYLAQNVIEGLPFPLQQFLARTAVPLHFNDELAAVLLDNPASAASLRAEAQQRNLFLEPAGEPGWFRYHALVREYLLGLAPDMMARRAERVVAWFEARGDRATAIEQALEAGMPERAARLIADIAPDFVNRTGQLRTYSRWISALDDDTRARYPLLLTRLGLDYANFARFEPAQAWLQAGYALAGQHDQRTRARTLIDQATYLIHHAENGESALALIAPLLDEPDLPPALRRTVLKLTALGLQMRSQYRQSAQFLHQALAIPETPDGPPNSALYQNLFVTFLEQGDWAAAERMLREYERHATTSPMLRIRLASSWGWLHEAMGDWDGLERDIAVAGEIEARLEQPGFNQDDWARLRALLLIGRGELEAAATLLEACPSPDLEESSLNWHTYRAWLARRARTPRLAAEIADEALARPGSHLDDRGMLALERDIAVWEAGLERPLRPETRVLIALRNRPQIIRLRALLALRCWQAGNGRWRHHVAAALRGLGRPEYRRLLTNRDPELGEQFYTLAIRAGAPGLTAAFQRIGRIEPLLPLLRDPEIAPAAALILAELGDERAMPPLTAALDNAADRPTKRALSAALDRLEQAAPPTLDIRLLGGFSVTRAGAPIPNVAWERPIVQRLVQYFALARSRPIARERVLDDLWPDSEPHKAAASFRTVYSILQHVLDPYLRPRARARYFQNSDNVYTFDPLGRVRVDVAEFDRIVSAALLSAARADIPPLDDQLLQALQNYGPLLPHLPYAEWLLEPRERLNDRYAGGCHLLAEALLTRARPAEALPWAERAIAAAPWMEEAHQARVRALARMGRRSAALQAVYQVAEALRTHLNTNVSAATAWLAERLQGDEEI